MLLAIISEHKEVNKEPKDSCYNDNNSQSFLKNDQPFWSQLYPNKSHSGM